MVSYLKRQNLHEISIGAGEESYEQLSGWMNDSDREFGDICLAIFIPCTSATPPLFLALILKAPLKILNITLFSPYILLPQMILYHFIL